MRINTKLLIGSMSLVAVVAMGSCTSDVKCGTGTIEKDGECVFEGTPNGGNCGGGSTFNPATQQCEITQCAGGNPCGICGPNTVPETDAHGITTCVGQGGEPPCDQDLACPPADSNRQMICGRLVDTETSAFVTGDDLPNTVKISFYEANAFAMDPASAPSEFSVAPDKCGRYVSAVTGKAGVAIPGTMFILVGTDDAADSGAGPGGSFITTGIALLGVGGSQLKKANTYLTSAQTNAHWSGAMDPTFVDRGVFLGVFVDTTKPKVGPFNGTPVPGVTLLAPAVDVDHDFYFSDTMPLLRSSVGNANVTGVNGSVLFTPTMAGSLDTYNGMGPTGCEWGDGLLATALPNTIFVQEHEGTCP
jgi:hypothetical protein